MAERPFDDEVDAQHAELRRVAQLRETQRRARAASARNDLLAAAARPASSPPLTQRRRMLFSIGEEVALERAAKACGLAPATFARAAVLHFVARLDPGKETPRSQKRSDPPRTSPPSSGVDRSASRSAEPSQLERTVARAATESVRTGETIGEALERMTEEERER